MMARLNPSPIDCIIPHAASKVVVPYANHSKPLAPKLTKFLKLCLCRLEVYRTIEV